MGTLVLLLVMGLNPGDALAPSPTTAQNDPTAVLTPKVTPRPSPSPAQWLGTSSRVTLTTATWYCLAGRSRCTVGYPDRPGPDFYAAISRDLGLGRLRGKIVETCLANDPTRCVRVKIVDCLCSRSGIDLYGNAFARLAPLGRGRINVILRY